ncbi:MAG: type III-A CRISPR-associated RAMP protein Csm3 [Anaerolineae bacterium]|nr:type III-A CRISPR-associated RAMP protein Csm3 [Anaerolineae bacterium]
MATQLTSQITLYGRVFVRGDIRLVTGLHIGAERGELTIGGVDKNAVLRDILTNQPYIPGSSLRGKMRSLAEKTLGAPQNKNMGSGVRIHSAETRPDYDQFWVNPVFGIPAEVDYDPGAPTRLIVRDVFLSETSVEELEKARTDQPFTEVKTEVSIDRVTAKANPRSMERVPAKAVFSGMEMVYSVFLPGDFDYFWELLRTMRVLEDDYLGGQGTRGSGKIQFGNLTISTRARANYQVENYYGGNDARFTVDELLATGEDPEMLANGEDLFNWIQMQIPIE